MVDIHIQLITVTKMWRELRGKSRTTTATRDSAARMTTILEVSVRRWKDTHTRSPPSFPRSLARSALTCARVGRVSE